MSKIVLVSLYDEFCFGIRYLSSYLQANRHSVWIINFKILSEINKKIEEEEPGGYYILPCCVSSKEISLFVELIEKLNPDYIGFSFTANFFGLTILLSEKLKYLNKPIIWGGVVVTLNPESALEYNDIVCVGEGEETLLEFIELHCNNKDYTKVKNLWFKNGANIIKNEVRPPYPNLDDFPFPDFDQKKKFVISDGKLFENQFPPASHLNSSAMIISGRGCPYSCTYCCNNYFNKKLYPKMTFLRRRSVENVVAELKYRIKTMSNLTFIEFIDDVFTLHRDWLREFGDRYKKEIKKPFWCFTHPSACKREIIEILKDCGISYTVIGIQSGSERILYDVFNRRTSREKIINACNIINSVGVRYIIDLIGLNPFETEQDRWDTLTLLLKLPHPFFIHPVNPLALYPKHEITERALELGYIQAKRTGRDCFLIEEEKIHRFWNAVHRLSQFEDLSDSTIITIAKDENLRNNPEIVEELLSVLLKFYYYKGNWLLPKDEYIKSLENERKKIQVTQKSKIRKILGKMKEFLS